MSPALTRLNGRKPVRWTTILGIILVPLTVAGVLLWGLWNPNERLDSITAAVVNNDEPVEVDGQTVPLGRVLAGELVGAPDGAGTAGSGSGESGADDTEAANFTWVLTDAEDAESGLDDGRYATVVTIPENFSAAATSLSGDLDAAEQAHIDIAQSDRGRLIDTALSGIVTRAATGVLNQTLGEQFVGGVFVGMNEIGSGIGEAADGATQLADGGKKLAGGASELADGTEQLADGTGQLADGATQLADGVGQLSGGASELSTGASALSSGAGELSTGASDFATGVGQYVAGAGTLAESYAPLEQGAAAAAAQLKTMITALGQLQVDAAQPQQDLESGLTAAQAAMAGLAGSGTPEDAGHIGELYGKCLGSGADQGFCDEMLGTLTSDAQAIGGALGTAGAGAAGLAAANQTFQNSLAAGGTQGGNPVEQLDALIAGLGDFGDGLDDFASQGSGLNAGAEKLAGGMSDLAGGASQLSAGTSELAAGTTELSSGASQLATGTSELAANTPELAQGASELAKGAGRSAGGASDLAKGLHEAADGIPNTSETQRDKLAKTALAPVEARGANDELFNSSGVPLFAGVALWAGALAAFMLLAPLWRRTGEAALGVGRIALRSALPALGLGALQGAIAGTVLPLALGYDLAKGLGFFGFALLAGISFSLLVQGLSALLGGFGRFIAFVLLVVAFAVGIVSTVPGPLASLGDLSPIGSALGGFQAIATGVSGAGGAMAVLVLWGLVGLAFTALAVGRTRRKAA